jgi:hypothetical protein
VPLADMILSDRRDFNAAYVGDNLIRRDLFIAFARFRWINAAGDDHQQLRDIARKLLEKASKGDMQAINCLADRLDGKPAQALEVNTPPSYVARLPEPAKTVEEWQAMIAGGQAQPSENPENNQRAQTVGNGETG